MRDTQESVQRVRSVARALMSGRVAGLVSVWMFGVCVGGLLFVSRDYSLRDGVDIVEGASPVSDDENSFIQARRLSMQRLLRRTNAAMGRVANEMTWASGRSVRTSWVQQTNFPTLRINSTWSNELRDVARSLGAHVGSLSQLTNDSFAVVTRSGMVLVYDTPKVTVSQRFQLEGVIATDDLSTGIREATLISIVDSTARFVATYASAVTSSRDCTRVALVTFAIRLAGGPGGGDHSIGAPQPLWTSSECVPMSGSVGEGIGGRLFFDPPNHLYLTLGDMTTRHPEGSYFGTLLDFRFEDGTIVGEPTVVSKGFRNPSGLTLAGGRIYVANQGPRGGDSINIAAPGKDFGWPKVSYGREYVFSGYPSPGNSVGNFDTPAYVWMPSPAVSDLDVNRTTSFDTWFNEEGIGDLLVASLKGRSVYRCRTSPRTGLVVYCEQIYIGERLRDVLSLRGSLILLSDAGHVYHITLDSRW